MAGRARTAEGVELTHADATRAQWGLVVAGLADLKRPAENISLPQSSALALTGLIWARYATQIIPKNYNLLSVNLFVAATGCYQLYRIYDWKQSQKLQGSGMPVVAPSAQPQQPKADGQAKH